MKTQLFCLLPALLMIVFAGSISADQASDRQKLLTDSKRIVFLGDSITSQGNYVVNFDVWLQATYPDRQFSVMNLGLSSETVAGLSEKGHAGGRFPRPDLHTRLDSVLEKTKPDLIFACYGMNDGIYQPFDEGRFKKYQDGIIKLKAKAGAAGAKIVFITPPYYDNKGASKNASYTDLLAKYSAWLVSQRAKGWQVIDLNTAMAESILTRRIKNPKFTVQRDSVHPNPQGHWFMTQPILAWFGDEKAAKAENIGEVLATHKLPAAIAQLTAERQQIMHYSWLTRCGHKRPGVPKGLPFDQAEKKAAEITIKAQELLKKF